MDLPALADAMYKTWWSFANYAASAQASDGSYLFTVADASSAASQINRDVYGGQGGYNPIGLSQLFSVARKIANGTKSVDAADDSSPITARMVTEAPWSRPTGQQTAAPRWQARVEMIYTDPSGITQPGFATVEIAQVLPSTVGSLRAQLGLRIQDQLSTPPGTGTPRTGSLDSIESITLLAVLRHAGRFRPLPEAGREDSHAGNGHVLGHRDQGRPTGRPRGAHAAPMGSQASPPP